MSIRVISLHALGIACALNAFAQVKKQPADYVNPEIGGISILLTSTEPYVQYPHGMARLAPMAGGNGDHYLADRVSGFPAGPAMLMAFNGDVPAGPGFTSHFDHDFETSTPYYYSVRLDDSDIRVEMTATQHDGFYRFTFPASGNSQLKLAVRGILKLDGTSAVGGSAGNEYFYAKFSKPLDNAALTTLQPATGSERGADGRGGFGGSGNT